MIETEIIPVIHMLDVNQVMKNVDTCLSRGVNKVFLINHQVSIHTLLDCADDLTESYEGLSVGANLLGVRIEDAISMPFIGFLDMLWCDQTLSKEASNVYRTFQGLLFTGLAFKYQPQPEDLKAACEEAVKATDVITTSGAGTGLAPDIDKIKRIREYIGDHPLAIASGVSAENVGLYKGLANYLLVATSITGEDELIDKDKLKELLDK